MSATEQFGAFGLGAAAFWTFFHHGEHFLYPTRYIQVFLLTVVAGGVFLANTGNLAVKEAIFTSFKLGGIFLVGVYGNCAIYRLFLNPLNKIPGPIGARLSKFDHVFRNAGLNAHVKLLEQHEKLGKFVRIGPNDISVTDADGVEVISGPKSVCTKSPWYEQDTPLISLHTSRDRTMHDRRRRVWAPAFSDRALRGYESRVQTLNDLLLSKLSESKGKSRTHHRNGNGIDHQQANH